LLVKPLNISDFLKLGHQFIYSLTHLYELRPLPSLATHAVKRYCLPASSLRRSQSSAPGDDQQARLTTSRVAKKALESILITSIL
jgi:hypothetical protein